MPHDDRLVRAVAKRSVTVRGHRTSYSIEQAFQDELVSLAERRGLSLAALVALIDAARPREINLSSALRLHVLEALQQASMRHDSGATDPD